MADGEKPNNFSRRIFEGVKHNGIANEYQFSIPAWLPHLLIIICVLFVSILYLWEEPFEVPLGDAYIHFVYARNLVDLQELTFNPELHEGVGTTSLLWVLILAFCYWLGLPMTYSAKILGMGLLAFTGCLLINLSQQTLSKYDHNRKLIYSTLIALIGTLSGSLVWMGLSGMETMLFTALGCFSLWMYYKRRWTILGITLGLLALTRVEGIILAGALILTEIFFQRRFTNSLIRIIIPILLLLMPWLIYLQFREGVPITNSFQGRQVVIFEVEKQIISEFPQFEWAFNYPPLIYLFCWLVFVFIHITGSPVIPGSSLSLGNSLLGTRYSIPLLGVTISFLISIPLLLVAFNYLWKQRKNFSIHKDSHRLIFAMCLWVFLHNLAYALFLPQLGSAGRYVPMNHIMFWILLVIGIFALRNRISRIVVSFATVGLLGVSLCYWYVIYQSNIDYMVNVRIASTRFIETEIPMNKHIGVTDLGPVRYYGNHTVIDLFGHVNQKFVVFYAAGGSWGDYIAEERLCYLLLFDSVENNGLDFTREMKLQNDPRFGLIKEKTFFIPTEEWILGNGPLQNTMPALSFYRIDWQDELVCQ